MQRNVEKCREMQWNAEKSRESQRYEEKWKEMQRNGEKCSSIAPAAFWSPFVPTPFFTDAMTVIPVLYSKSNFKTKKLILWNLGWTQGSGVYRLEGGAALPLFGRGARWGRLSSLIELPFSSLSAFKLQLKFVSTGDAGNSGECTQSRSGPAQWGDNTRHLYFNLKQSLFRLC